MLGKIPVTSSGFACAEETCFNQSLAKRSLFLAAQRRSVVIVVVVVAAAAAAAAARLGHAVARAAAEALAAVRTALGVIAVVTRKKANVTEQALAARASNVMTAIVVIFCVLREGEVRGVGRGRR